MKEWIELIVRLQNHRHQFTVGNKKFKQGLMLQHQTNTNQNGSYII